MIILREAVTATATLTINGESHETEVEIRPALMASRCASCSRHFRIQTVNGNKDAGRWDARMSGAPGRLGNGLYLDCCSMACATALENGGWKTVLGDGSKVDEIRQYKEAGCSVLFSEFKSGFVLYEEELVAKWEDTPLRGPEKFAINENRQFYVEAG